MAGKLSEFLWADSPVLSVTDKEKLKLRVSLMLQSVWIYGGVNCSWVSLKDGSATLVDKQISPTARDWDRCNENIHKSPMSLTLLSELEQELNFSASKVGEVCYIIIEQEKTA